MDKAELIREAVIDELARRGWTIYRLTRAMGEDGIRLQTAIYGWLAGRRRVTDSTASMILHRLDLKLF